MSKYGILSSLLLTQETNIYGIQVPEGNSSSVGYTPWELLINCEVPPHIDTSLLQNRIW